MSVVVYSDGVMVADSRAYSGSTHPIGSKMKIHRLDDGSLLGVTSNQVGLPEAFRMWIENGADREDIVPNEPSFEALHVLKDGSVYLYEDGYTPSGPLVGQHFAIGSGKKYAYGALLAGVSVVKSVEVAIEADLFCGGPISKLSLSDNE
jgi:hypothetical protein